MDINPKPMSREWWASFVDCVGRLTSDPDDDLAHDCVMEWLDDAIADRAWHRAQVKVTDEHILAVSVTPEQTCAWFLRHGWHEDPPRRFEHPSGCHLTTVRDQVTPTVVNIAASGCGRAPLDVLDEIAAMEVTDG